MKPYSSQLVESLQNWKELGTDNISRLNKALELYSNAIPVTESEYLQQPKSLLEQMIVAIIATDNISFDKLKKCIYDNVTDEKAKEDLTKVSHDEIDLNRVRANHEIINKRFSIKSIFSMNVTNNTDINPIRILIGSEFPQLGMIEICKLLDTYSLSIQDKFALMVEELAYDYNTYTCLEDKELVYIIPTVHSYLFSTYPPSHTTEDIVAKVLDSIAQRVYNSVFIQKLNDIIGNNQISNRIKQSDVFDKIAEFEVSPSNTGDSTCIDKVVDLFSDIADSISNLQELSDMTKIVLPLYYQYFAVSNYSNNKDDMIRVLYTYIDTIYKKFADEFHNGYIKKIYDMVDDFLAKASMIPQNSESYQVMIEAIKEIKEMLSKSIEYYDAKKVYNLKGEPYDVNDNPTGIFTDYDNALLDDIEEACSIFQSNVLEESTISAFTDKELLIKADRDLLDYIEESYEKYYPLIDKSKLLLSLNEAVKEIRKDTTTPDNVSKISNLKEIINKVKNYHDENQDSMKDDDETDERVLSANIIPIKDYNQDKMRTYTIDRIAKYYNEDTILANNIAKEAMHEMKLSSYVTLGLDRLKKTASTLMDAQKTAWNNIDRFADTIEKINTEEDKREARMQVVKNSFLPSMSRCIKSIIIAGGLSVLVHPFVGLLSLVVRFVNSKRAAKEERQAVADELEVELEMIDRRIRDAEDSKDYKKERKLRLLKRKLITYLAKVAVDSKTKWNDEIMFKKDIDDAGSELGLRHDD